MSSESDQQRSADWRQAESRVHPNYSVSLAQLIIPAADLSEQFRWRGRKLPAPVT